jgi:hypothetical protein
MTRGDSSPLGYEFSASHPARERRRHVPLQFMRAAVRNHHFPQLGPIVPATASPLTTGMASSLLDASPRTAPTPPSRAALLTGPPFAALSAALGRPVATATASPLAGGMANEMSSLRVVYEDGSVESFALKTNSLGRATGTAVDADSGDDGAAPIPAAVAFGTAREALFYVHLAPAVRAALPAGSLARCAFAAGDLATGRKTLLLELLSGGVDSGLVFGGGSPLNWARPEAVAAASALATPEAAAASVFRLAARLHGAFWCDTTLLAHDWLHGARWRRAGPLPGSPAAATADGDDGGESEWRASLARAVDGWAAARRRQPTSGSSSAGAAADAPIDWDAEFPTVAAAMDAAMATADWAAYRAWAQAAPFTLCQADCHPGNALLFPPAAGDEGAGGGAAGAPSAARWPPRLPRTALVDWEVVSAGSGPQDLGQYVISHMAPAARRGCEGRLLRAYHAELCDAIRQQQRTASTAASAVDDPRPPAGAAATATAVALPSYEDVYAEYVAGGLGRWAWLLGLLVGMCPPPALRFWGSQLAAFIADHAVAPADVGMPRP